jgi:hypothetical protein
VTTWQASYAYLFGDRADGCAARTVQVSGDMAVDLDTQNRVIGVETLGDDLDWTQALVKLAMAGRLAVPERGDLWPL